MNLVEFAAKVGRIGSELDAKIFLPRLTELVSTANSLCNAQGIRTRFRIVQVGRALQVRPVPGSGDLARGQDVLTRTLRTNSRVFTQAAMNEIARRLE